MKNFDFTRTAKETISVTIILGLVACSSPEQRLAKAHSAYEKRDYYEVIDLLKGFPADNPSIEEVKHLRGKAIFVYYGADFTLAASVFNTIDSASPYFEKSMEFVLNYAKHFIEKDSYSNAAQALKVIHQQSIHYKEAQKLLVPTEETARRKEAEAKKEEQRISNLLDKLDNGLTISHCSLQTIPIENKTISEQFAGYEYHVYASLTINNASECDIKDFVVMFFIYGESGTYLNRVLTSYTIYKLVPTGKSVEVSDLKIGGMRRRDIKASCKIKSYEHECFDNWISRSGLNPQ